MAETADVLARPAVTVEIKRLIVRAMRDGGISQTHATRVGLAMADRIFGGEPVAEASALVDAILKDARAGALEEAARMVDDMRDEEITDLRQVRDRLEAAAKAAKTPTPERENVGA